MEMTLSEYLAQPGQTATALAEKCGVAVSTITRVAKGDQGASAELMGLIHTHTSGAVSPNDLLGIAA